MLDHTDNKDNMWLDAAMREFSGCRIRDCTLRLFAVASCDIARSVYECMYVGMYAYIHMNVYSAAIHIVVHQLQQNNVMQTNRTCPPRNLYKPSKCYSFFTIHIAEGFFSAPC